MTKTALLSLFIVLFTFSCKTREDIAREKKIEDMSSQMQDRQKLSADFVTRIQELENQITNLNTHKKIRR